MYGKLCKLLLSLTFLNLEIASLLSNPNYSLIFNANSFHVLIFYYFVLFKKVFHFEISYVKIKLLLKFLLQYCN